MLLAAAVQLLEDNGLKDVLPAFRVGLGDQPTEGLTVIIIWCFQTQSCDSSWQRVWLRYPVDILAMRPAPILLRPRRLLFIWERGARATHVRRQTLHHVAERASLRDVGSGTHET